MNKKCHAHLRELDDVLYRLLNGRVVGRGDIRRVGQIAAEHGVKHGAGEGYGAFLKRLIAKIERERT